MAMFMFLEFTLGHNKDSEVQGCKKARLKEDTCVYSSMAKSESIVSHVDSDSYEVNSTYCVLWNMRWLYFWNNHKLYSGGL